MPDFPLPAVCPSRFWPTWATCSTGLSLWLRALSAAVGEERWQVSQPRAWAEEQQRFFSSLRSLDSFLASDGPLHAPIEQLFQGPVADALTHVGQLAMLRRMSGSPTRGENFYVAAIQAGQVDAAQPKAVKPSKAH